MALASMHGDPSVISPVQPQDIFEVDGAFSVTFRNDWQNRVERYDDELQYAPLAHATQCAFQSILLQHAKLAQHLTGCSSIAVSGGVFLNILVNSAIAESKLFNEYYVPSAPHDAGISIGCANVGWTLSTPHSVGIAALNESDRLGPIYGPDRIEMAVSSGRSQANLPVKTSAIEVARLLAAGHIIARFEGRSEFGPRALGGRSLLASPMLASSKKRLNVIKGRQPWRPVAPIVTAEDIKKYFDGPEASPHMSFLHFVRTEHREALAALHHPDGSTRAQTLDRHDDETLYELLIEFEKVVGYPILVNTSLNGRGEPIVETPEDALSFFETHPDVDVLLLYGQLLRRDVSGMGLRLAPDTMISLIFPIGKKRIFLSRRDASMEISSEVFDLIYSHRALAPCPNHSNSYLDEQISREIGEAARLGLLVCSRDEISND
jgi:carbamoyltransferase